MYALVAIVILVSMVGVIATFIGVRWELRRTSALCSEAEARFRLLGESIGDVCWMMTGDERQVLYVSPAYETVFERPCADFYANARDWFTAIHPDDRARIRAGVSSQDETHQEFRLFRADGSIRWIRNKRFYVRDEAGKILRIAGIAEDITERRALEEQLRQVHKLDALGMMAGGVAHDFNNILSVIGANAELLQEAYEPALVDEIALAVRRAGALTQQLLAFSRKQVTEPVEVDLNAAMHDVRTLVARLVGPKIRVETSFEPDVGRVCVDPSSLVQIVMNLAVNARDAMPDGGKLRIETRSLGLHDVMISVKDTGTGMPPAVIARVFEPFFTTKPTGKGTGLGLAVVHGAVEQAGGKIEIASTPGKGTTFRITLPLASPGVLASPRPVCATKSEKILLVDDDAYLRGALSHGLRAAGYHVVEARDTHDLSARLAEDAPSLVVVANGKRVEHGSATRVLYLAEGGPLQLGDLTAKIRCALDARQSRSRLA